MSKLDDIEYELYSGIPPEHEDGTYKTITDKTRKQIKDLMLDIAEHSYLENQSSKSAAWLDAFRKEVEEL
jgi:hypothetical protein